ncbi:MAG: IS200/IS605 family transposase [Pirellulales bacterium]
MPQSFSSLHVHVVFSTKDRTPLIRPELASRLHPYLGGISNELACPAVAIGGMPDHVHMLVDLSRERTVADVVRTIKTNSSKWMRQELGERRFVWQTGYGAFAVNRSNLEDVKGCIADQAEHHRIRTFQEEFRMLLEKHGLEFDERYLWA